MTTLAARNAVVSLIFCLACAAAVASALGFAVSSEFLTDTGGGVFHCKELLSSGGDDELAMAFLSIVIPSILWRAFHWKRPIFVLEIGVFLGVYGVAFAVITMSLDCGDFFFTAFGVGDAYLQAFCVFSAVAAGALIAQKVAGLAKQ